MRAGTLTGVVAISAGGNHCAAVNDRGSLGADPEALHQSDAPMRPGQAIPPECRVLFACLTANGKVIRICGGEDPDDIEKWSKIHYRYGPPSGPPDFMFPADPDSSPPSLFYSQETSKREQLDIVRFSNGGYTYRVYYGAKSGGGVEVEDANRKKLSSIACAERPEFYREYLRTNLPCDPKNRPGCKVSGSDK